MKLSEKIKNALKKYPTAMSKDMTHTYADGFHVGFSEGAKFMSCHDSNAKSTTQTESVSTLIKTVTNLIEGTPLDKFGNRDLNGLKYGVVDRKNRKRCREALAQVLEEEKNNEQKIL